MTSSTLAMEDDTDTDSDSANSSSSEDSESDYEDRLQNTDWCECDRCASMPTPMESLCCSAVPELTGKITSENVDCIVEHPGFSVVVLNQDVLTVSLLEGADNQQDNLQRLLPNNKLRYQAYRQFTCWTYKRVGKYIRKVIPACVIKKIRDTFPSSNGLYEYDGF